MEPVAWGHAALAGVPSEQNLLANQCHHDGVVHVMVGGIAVGNILQRETADETDDVPIVRLERPIDQAVLFFKLLDKGLDDNLCGIKHDRLSSANVIPVRARRNWL